MNRRLASSILVTAVVTTLACGFAQPGAATMTLHLSSRSFAEGQEIPVRHTCEGVDVSPSLEWTGAPEGTRSFALVVDDPDAPDPRAPKTTWVHWVAYDIPANVTSLPEGGPLPAGARSGRNDWRVTGFRGPCPPIGRHRYFHKLYALDVVLAELGEPDKAALEAAMKGHVLAQATLVGTYTKAGHK